MKNRIRSWLGFSEEFKQQRQMIDETLSEFRKTLEKFCEIDCTQCGKKIVTYPYGGGYYREQDGSVICSNECLDARRQRNE